MSILANDGVSVYTNQLLHRDTLLPAVPDIPPPADQGNRHTPLAAAPGSRADHSPVEGEEAVHSPAVEVDHMLAVHTPAARILAVLEAAFHSLVDQEAAAHSPAAEEADRSKTF